MHRWQFWASERPSPLPPPIKGKVPEANFMNVQFRWGFRAQSWELSALSFTLPTSFNPFLFGGGGGDPLVEVTENSKEENS